MSLIHHDTVLRCGVRMLQTTCLPAPLKECRPKLPDHMMEKLCTVVLTLGGPPLMKKGREAQLSGQKCRLVLALKEELSKAETTTRAMHIEPGIHGKCPQQCPDRRVHVTVVGGVTQDERPQRSMSLNFWTAADRLYPSLRSWIPQSCSAAWPCRSSSIS